MDSRRRRIWWHLATYTITLFLKYHTNVIDSLLHGFVVFQIQTSLTMKSDVIFKVLRYSNFLANGNTRQRDIFGQKKSYLTFDLDLAKKKLFDL